jgi:Kef-type K+ transport system membrane component KefB/voltage-gated potassium channel Kch
MAAEGIDGMILLWDIGIIILASTIFAFLAKALKQPLVLAYVLAGIVIGPFGPFPLITNEDIVITLAGLGVAFLLFMVGLELDIKRLKDVGRVSAGCGIGQIIITFFVGLLLANLLGFSERESLYIAFALTISSTMIVVKLLSDKGELDTLHGKIVLGTLLIQDVVTIMALAVLTTLEDFSIISLGVSILTGLGLVSVAILSGRFILPPFLRFAAKSVELLFLTSLAWCFAFSAFAYLAFSNLLGFEVTSSLSIGAFLAGVSLASFPYNLEILGRIRSLKDFFATIFFVSLGMQVPLQFPLLQPVLIFSLFVLIGTPLIMISITTLFGYGKRTALLTGLSLAQISEFSFILAMEGLFLKHITLEIFSLITWIALVTITISSYFIIHSDQIYNRILPSLKIFERISRNRELEDIPTKSKGHVVVFGCHRMGCIIVETLQLMRRDFLVVDLNPDIVKSLIGQRIPSIYGDMGDIEILERIRLKDADVVISTIPNLNDNLLLIEETRKRNPKTLIIITADHINGALTLYNNGADYVILPNILSGEKVSTFLMDYILSKERFASLKKKHILQLENQKRLDFLMRYDSSFLGSLERKFNHNRQSNHDRWDRL